MNRAQSSEKNTNLNAENLDPSSVRTKSFIVLVPEASLARLPDAFCNFRTAPNCSPTKTSASRNKISCSRSRSCCRRRRVRTDDASDVCRDAGAMLRPQTGSPDLHCPLPYLQTCPSFPWPLSILPDRFRAACGIRLRFQRFPSVISSPSPRSCPTGRPTRWCPGTSSCWNNKIRLTLRLRQNCKIEVRVQCDRMAKYLTIFITTICIQFLPKRVQNVSKNPINPEKIAKHLNFCQSGKISPNLVALKPTLQLNR